MLVAWFVTDSHQIPKNPTGKILRRILQDKFEAQQVELKAKM